MDSYLKSFTPGIRYAHELLFNCMVFLPDKSVEEFVKKYIPILRRREADTGGWTSNLPLRNADQIMPVIHAFSYYDHPYFKGNFIQGYLIFHVNELDGASTGFRTIENWLYYDSKEVAESDLKILCMPFNESGFFKRTEMENAVLRIICQSETKDDLWYGNPQFHLVQDQIFPKIFKIRFSFGCDEEVMKFL
ncbi:MAG: hypothetical protein Q8939_19200 [Bacteroidota bacterium]|nr:hypothetical protein [Bacteroidota bacterium]